ncbi:MAG: GFA family protein [Pseudomonadota bacterium]
MSALLQGELEGGCNCGAVRYRLREGFRLSPYACHCTDCQTRTGSAFSEHMLFREDDLDIEGPLSIGTMVQPSGAVSRVYGCAKCMARIYATNDRRAGFASLRCGTLDNSKHLSPAAHIWVGSKQPWIILPDGVPTVETQPMNETEWLELLKPQ